MDRRSLRGVRDGDWKLLYRHRGESTESWLFNLAAENKETHTRLRKNLERWERETVSTR